MVANEIVTTSKITSARYELRTVAFIDILGFSDLVARSERDEEFFARLYQALRIVNHQGRVWVAQALSAAGASTEQMQESLAAMDFRSHTFSDSLILSQRGAMVAPLFIRVSQLAMALLNLGVLVRGGIAQGLLCHDATMVFGPALIEAYHLENKCARFPRILVSEAVCETSHKEIIHFPSMGSHAAYFLCDLLRRDADRLYHLDYLTTTLLSPSAVIGSNNDDYLTLLKKAGSLALEEFKRPTHKLEIKAQWGWFVDYYNDFTRIRTSHLPEVELNPIVLEDDEMDPFVTWEDLRIAYYRRRSESAND